MALSQTWGASPNMMATRATIDDLKCGVAVSFLPLAFRDAIFITRRLGVQYLWIDFLCVV